MCVTVTVIVMRHATLLALLLLAVGGGLTHLGTAQATALDDYVAKPDPYYQYDYRHTRHGVGYSVHVVTMTSQQWRSLGEVNRVLWEHGLRIAVPWISHSPFWTIW